MSKIKYSVCLINVASVVIHVFMFILETNFYILFLHYGNTSEVPVEHETLKSGRDGTRQDAMGRNDNDEGRWNYRREG